MTHSLEKRQYQTVIGLEIHAQILSKSKLFSDAPNDAFGSEPNTCVSFVDAGFPGMLPVLNRECVAQGVKTGLALGAQIHLKSIFERKNYFYPDNPSGYQISQNQHPLVTEGHLVIKGADGNPKLIRIQRLHLEQDAGKSFHDRHPHYSYIDLNRAGVPLMEIVSYPDLSHPDEVVEYVKAVRCLLRYIGTCDGNMEKGNLRVDANVSVHFPGEPLGTRVELKNMNSLRFLHQALNYEIQRQIDCLTNNQPLHQETRMYDVKKGITLPLREKEDSYDYLYFPDPDLPPCILSQEWIDEIKTQLPELPQQKKERFQSQWGLTEYDAHVLTQEKEMADFFEQTLSHLRNQSACKMVSHWMIGEIFASLNKDQKDIDDCPVSPSDLAELVDLIAENKLSRTLAKEVFTYMWDEGKPAQQVMQEKNLQMLSGDSLSLILTEVLKEQEKQVMEFLSGKEKVFDFLFGQAMKKSKGQCPPEALREALKKELESRKS
jgi:aspartyl-tRNA(Asn)/glutamyl-tRNA(Gln) amidotransferase subunit B